MARTQDSVSRAVDLHTFHHHWQDEADAAYLYRLLAGAEKDPKKSDLYRRLAEVEDRHVEIWARLLREHGGDPGAFRPSARTRLLASLGKMLGPGFLLPMLLSEEGREVKSYLDMHRRTARGAPGASESLQLARESAEHATTLTQIAGRSGEPWHRTESGGFLRNVVYGFNDGLTANFGLVAGVIGASIAPHLVVVTGIAGALADALSMGSSGYLAAKSEAEVAARQVAIERDELRLMPDLEEKELALILEAKGLTPEHARESAEAMMRDPQRALETKVQEELRIQPPSVTPLADGVVTGTATAFGAVIPLIPFLTLPLGAAIWASLTISMLAHFAVGAARSIFTGRSVWASGRDMFLVGFGVAAAGYFIGSLVIRL